MSSIGNIILKKIEMKSGVGNRKHQQNPDANVKMCECTGNTDIRGRCMPSNRGGSKEEFLGCSQRIETTYWLINNTYEEYKFYENQKGCEAQVAAVVTLATTNYHLQEHYDIISLGALFDEDDSEIEMGRVLLDKVFGKGEAYKIEGSFPSGLKATAKQKQEADAIKMDIMDALKKISGTEVIDASNMTDEEVEKHRQEQLAKGFGEQISMKINPTTGFLHINNKGLSKKINRKSMQVSEGGKMFCCLCARDQQHKCYTDNFPSGWEDNAPPKLRSGEQCLCEPCFDALVDLQKVSKNDDEILTIVKANAPVTETCRIDACRALKSKLALEEVWIDDNEAAQISCGRGVVINKDLRKRQHIVKVQEAAEEVRKAAEMKKNIEELKADPEAFAITQQPNKKLTKKQEEQEATRLANQALKNKKKAQAEYEKAVIECAKRTAENEKLKKEKKHRAKLAKEKEAKKKAEVEEIKRAVFNVLKTNMLETKSKKAEEALLVGSA